MLEVKTVGFSRCGVCNCCLLTSGEAPVLNVMPSTCYPYRQSVLSCRTRTRAHKGQEQMDLTAALLERRHLHAPTSGQHPPSQSRGNCWKQILGLSESYGLDSTWAIVEVNSSAEDFQELQKRLLSLSRSPVLRDFVLGQTGLYLAMSSRGIWLTR